MKNNILLCDLGGTHARFAKYESKGEYSNFKKYRLNDFESFEEIVDRYYRDTNLKFEVARFATALMPVNNILGYKKFKGEQSYKIDLERLQNHYKWSSLQQVMDLEAAGCGLKILDIENTQTLISSSGPYKNNGKVLISVGTGVAHALVGDGWVSKFTDGHLLPITVTEEHRKIEKFIRRKKGGGLSLIMEDFVSGRGLRAIAEYTSVTSNDDMAPEEFMRDLKNNPDAIRLFFEFLGLYAHNVVSVTGFYGGVYLTGGVIDNLIKNNLVDWGAFARHLRPPMLPVVDDRLNSTSVNYVLHDELPLLGLTNF